MRYILLFLAATPLFGQTSDEQQIKQVVASEVNGLLTASDSLAEAWHPTAYSHLMVSSSESRGAWSWLVAGDELRLWLADSEKEPFTGARLTQSNHQFRIVGTAALVIYDQRIDLPDQAPRISRELKFLEKIDGVWKITAGSAHFYDPE